MAVVDANTVEATEPEVVEEQPSNLPSEAEETQKTPWERAREDGFLPEDYKEDPYELAKELANANKYVQEVNAEKAKAGKQAEKQQAMEATKEEILSMVPEFMANNMELTEEMETKANELGIDIRDLKLGAIELRDKINSAYNIVGGEAEYKQMMADMSEIMTDDQKRSFNEDLGGSASEWAIKGLHAEWKSRNGSPAKRIEGRVGGGSGAKPHDSQAELLKDLTYLRTRGKNDKAAWAQHEKRKSVTPDNVIYGR